MYRRMNVYKVFVLAAIFFVCVTVVYAQEEVERAKAPFKPVEPPRLFIAPTADIIPSLDLSLAGGGSLGAKAVSFEGTAAFGLAGIAQIEFTALGIGSSLREGGFSNVYAPGFKMMLLRTGKWTHSSGISSPGLAWALRSSVWREEEGEKNRNITFQTKVADLYFVATERIGPLSLHAGLDIIDARLKSDAMKGQDPEEAKNSFYKPFGGLDVWVTDKGKAMAEFGWTPNFTYNEVDGIQKDEDIESVWVALLGVRFFATRYIAADVGVRYQGDYEGVSDANIEAKIDLSIPTHLLYEYAKGNR